MLIALELAIQYLLCHLIIQSECNTLIGFDSVHGRAILVRLAPPPTLQLVRLSSRQHTKSCRIVCDVDRTCNF